MLLTSVAHATMLTSENISKAPQKIVSAATPFFYRINNTIFSSFREIPSKTIVIYGLSFAELFFMYILVYLGTLL